MLFCATMTLSTIRYKPRKITTQISTILINWLHLSPQEASQPSASINHATLAISRILYTYLGAGAVHMG